MNDRSIAGHFGIGLEVSSLIERGFPLQCLGNNALEHLPTNANENGNRWGRSYCKEESWTPH